MSNALTPEQGDVVFNFSGKVVIRTGSNDEDLRITIQGDTLETTSANFQQVNMDGTDLQSRIDNIPQTPGVGLSNVQSTHIAPMSLQMECFDMFHLDKGGTGFSNLIENEVLVTDQAGTGFARDHGLMVTRDRGLVVPGGVLFTDTINTTNTVNLYENEANGHLMLDINDGMLVRDLHAPAVGVPPVVTVASLSVSETTPADVTVSFDIIDSDGDLRSAHVAIYDSEPTGVSRDDILLWTLKGGDGASGTPPLATREIEFQDQVNSGSVVYSSNCVFTGTGLQQGDNIHAHVVGEDGPGNLSDIYHIH